MFITSLKLWWLLEVVQDRGNIAGHITLLQIYFQIFW